MRLESVPIDGQMDLTNFRMQGTDRRQFATAGKPPVKSLFLPGKRGALGSQDGCFSLVDLVIHPSKTLDFPRWLFRSRVLPGAGADR